MHAQRASSQLEYSIIYTAPAQLNPILLLFNRGETFLSSFHWGHVASQRGFPQKTLYFQKVVQIRIHLNCNWI